MTQISRRTVLALGGASVLAACNGAILGNGVGSNGAAQIDARVQATKSYLFQTYPGTRDLEQKALGVLYMPLVTEIGFGLGLAAAYISGYLRTRPPPGKKRLQGADASRRAGVDEIARRQVIIMREIADQLGDRRVPASGLRRLRRDRPVGRGPRRRASRREGRRR